MAEILNLGLYYLDKAVTNLGYQRRDGENFTPTEVTENVKVKTTEIMALSGSRFFVRLGGLSGAVAVSMAAYGAHAFKVDDEKGAQLKKTFETGNKMHLVHSVALVCSPLCGRPYLTGALFTIGTILFSGSCYVHALTGNTKVRYITPYGGFALIFAWLSMLL
ncbi:transmembrane protein 256 homolog [Crassostrea virginica]|uniref:Transmembrane protein 256 homolog n=1 Tax=Crassostrea virginica TaxID=6565 RepID=A0A8B8ABG5_CRAVI|nr:transmembrane protein 256 homolog [Crassostrea virginica]